MTRISNFVQHQSLLAELQKTNERIYKSQMQISTGKLAQQYKDIPQETGVLLSAKRVETRTAQYQTTVKQLANRLDMQNVSLEQFASTAGDLRQALLDGISLGSGQVVMEEVDGAFRQALAVLNTKLDGNYIYGGTRTDQAPVNAASLSDLIAAPTISTVFDNNAQRIGVEVDTGQTLQYNFLADEVGQELMDSMKRIAEFNAGPNGPFAAHLTEAQRAFLTNEAVTLKTITENLNQIVARNGQYQNEVEDAGIRHESTTTAIKTFISDIEDADVAAAVTNLNQNQVVLEATARLIADLRRSSLLDYL